MAELVTQSATAVALRLAMLEIDCLDLRQIAFVCRGGTHRSVACACLSALVRYPRARLGFHTSRVLRDAAASLHVCDKIIGCDLNHATEQIQS